MGENYFQKIVSGLSPEEIKPFLAFLLSEEGKSVTRLVKKSPLTIGYLDRQMTVFSHEELNSLIQVLVTTRNRIKSDETKTPEHEHSCLAAAS